MRPRVLKGVVKALLKVMEVMKVVKPLSPPSTTHPTCRQPHESTYANKINIIVNACSNIHLFGHVKVRSAHCYVTKS